MMKVIAAALALVAVSIPAYGAEPDGLTLPPGFHATVVADDVKGLRHMAVRDNGDIYGSTRAKGDAPGIVALHLDADHKAAQVERFGPVANGTGIRFYHGALYASSPTAIYRFTLGKNELVPTAAPVKIVDGLPATGFLNRIIAFDGKGNLFVSVGGSGNICTDSKAPEGTIPVGLKPCPDMAGRSGVWRFQADKTAQLFPADGEQIVTGIRDMDALDWRTGDGLYGMMHGRNGTAATWPALVSAADDEAVGEEMHRMVKGANLGWPYTYYDEARHIRLNAPEYGGNGKDSPAPGTYSTPVVALPGHSAPIDLVFYHGNRFPAAYRGGAFVALHGGLGPEVPTGHNGYTVAFVKLDRSGHGTWSVFADGFAGPEAVNRNVSRATYRPTGLAVAPDGALYISDSQKGRIWRITYDASDARRAH